MQIEITLFGQLTDIAGSNSVLIDNVTNTEQLIQAVNKLYPAMGSIKYMIAVDKKTIQSNTILNEKSRVALLPAFSGG